MRLGWLVPFAAITIWWLSDPVASAGAKALDPSTLRHEMKLTFCTEQRGKRFYRTENLEDLCTLKVDFFDDLVSCTIINFANSFSKCAAASMGHDQNLFSVGQYSFKN